jgi:hypothetical protein
MYGLSSHVPADIELVLGESYATIPPTMRACFTKTSTEARPRARRAPSLGIRPSTLQSGDTAGLRLRTLRAALLLLVHACFLCVPDRPDWW